MRTKQRQRERTKLKMPETIWITLKKSFNCETKPSEVYEPKRTNFCRMKAQRKLRSVSNLMGVIHHKEKPPLCSPISRKSSQPLSPITSEVNLTSKVVGGALESDGGVRGGGSSFIGPPMTGSLGLRMTNLGGRELGSSIGSFSRISSRYMIAACNECGENLSRREAAEVHHLSKHAVTGLAETDSSRKIIEQIFKTGWSSSENPKLIDKILKVHNLETTLAQFEDYRERVKIKASRLPQKHHPRCLADGNELLRFYGTTLACSLGKAGSSGLCTSHGCNVCHILQHGFTSTKITGSLSGVCTTSSSQGAYKSVELKGENPHLKRALIICRVIAGRVQKLVVDGFFEKGQRSGFDSTAWKLSPGSGFEELYLLSPRALLPCFVIICRS